ncbi:MAG TPA: type II toxin-antitoxin system VapC family toxin [Stellaceae bacterium]|nr:type II toxin-antitoxin system VapC family toxin [Stellaceae bacterium]
MLPNGRIEVRARPTGSLEDFFGSLERSGTKPLTIEEINEIIADGLGRHPLRVTAATNILVRVAVNDDLEQARQERDLLRDAETGVLTLPALCECVWVARRGYRTGTGDIAAALQELLAAPSAAVDRPAVEAVLAMLKAGGDFADGVIAFEGRRLGGEVFASFDRQAVELVTAQGGDARFLPIN